MISVYIKHVTIAQIKVEYAKSIYDPDLPRGWAKYTKDKLANNKDNEQTPKERKKPISQIEEIGRAHV